MSTASPTFSQLKAQVAAIRKKVPRARVIGIQASGRWTAERQKREGEQSYLIQQCDSPLAMRLALREPVDEATTKILITPLEEKDLSDDILLRLAKRRLFPIDPWQIVRSLFQAQTVDPRLARHGWIAEMLLDLVPAEGYPAARGGFLDADTAWPLLLRHGIGLTTETPDLTSLLKWSLDADVVARFRHAGSAFREAAAEWLTEKAGPVAEVVLSCVVRLDRPDAVPLGLAVGVVYHPVAAGKLERASGKLEERFLGSGKSPEAVLVQRWSTAATEVVRALRHTDARAYRQTLQRADEILTEVQAEGFAYLSDTSPIGFDQRLARFGQCLEVVLADKSWDALNGLIETRQAVRDHDQSAREARCLERVDMAVRLVRWLGGRSHHAGAEPKSLAAAAAEHLRDGGFVDWARLSLRSGDPVQVLSEAYARLFEAVTQIREAQAQGFARLLADWTATGSQADDLLPVERFLEQIVAPLAADSPVLVIVIDGMSVAVCRELLADLMRHEWVALCEAGKNFNRPGITTIPSVTEFSRTSLLTGRLQAGGAAEERVGFADNPALVARCRSGFPPVLFHKATLQEAEDAVLAADVRREIGSAHRKIVGVVVNAVDDNLLKGGQIDTRWSRDEIKVLPALLHEARMARRLVVLVAKVTSTAPMFSAALRGYREAQAVSDKAAAEGILAWLAGQPNVAAGAKRAAGVKGDIDHFGALSFLQGVLIVMRDSGHPGLLLILDDVETIQRVRGDVRDKSLNALRQLIDEVDAGRFPGLYLLVTGTPAFCDGPQGAQRLEPLAQRLHVDFKTEARFDNPRAVQIRLPGFNLDRLCQVGCKVRDIFQQHAKAPERIAVSCDDGYIRELAKAVTGRLGGKVGVAPRIFLKKLVADVLDRVDQFSDFQPRQHYALTIAETELTPVERQAMGTPNVDARSLFSNLRAVIVDEIHAFAGDDRGWHLLSVLQRITRLAGRELQRIGLSATVGNPETLIDWLAGSCKGDRVVFQPAEAAASQAEVKLDYVGSLENAAVVISRLHRGEKRLVFVDSRARAEELGAGLRERGVMAFVTHSSLSQEQRRQAEDAFANRDDCVIVATSVLELGIDVGNLDRVIQIDSPNTVSSFLQRMGRTGRRQGTIRNCLFLATRDETLVQAAGLIDLWHEGRADLPRQAARPSGPAVGRPGLARDPRRLATESRPRRGVGRPRPHAVEGRRPGTLIPPLPSDQEGLGRRRNAALVVAASPDADGGGTGSVPVANARVYSGRREPGGRYGMVDLRRPQRERGDCPGGGQPYPDTDDQR